MKLDSEKLIASDLDLKHSLDPGQNQPSVVAVEVAAAVAAAAVAAVEAAVAIAVAGVASAIAAAGVAVVAGWIHVQKILTPGKSMPIKREALSETESSNACDSNWMTAHWRMRNDKSNIRLHRQTDQ
ncbi:hypothetical protein Patl1_14883 [Pistacia atlantica]|uniref:Uncharacterized protein n=1 Tax=Pistacia atlantica TaxID=434234 RepID=A0ACC1AV60_9ROSI|nr:hypothetical protein Patl1_14883 [Pistacia atlantica]